MKTLAHKKNTISLVILVIAIIIIPSFIQASTTTTIETSFKGYISGNDDDKSEDLDSIESLLAIDGDILLLMKLDPPKDIAFNITNDDDQLKFQFDINKSLNSGTVTITSITAWNNPLYFTLKAGDGYAVYDSNIGNLRANDTVTFSWSTTTSSTGIIITEVKKNGDTKSVFTDKELSHISFWSTKPSNSTDTNPTPEPATFILLGLGLIICSSWGRKRVKSN